jgi:deoxyribodipyrimidine photolyase-related protein
LPDASDYFPSDAEAACEWLEEQKIIMKIGLIFPHQLFLNHPVIESADQVFLVHESLILGGDSEWPLTPHAKKLLLHKASMAA